MPLQLHQNPLFATHDPAADLTDVAAPTVHRRPLATLKRELRDVRRQETAAAAIGPLEKGTEIYGFTKGQFSVIDIVNHCLDQIGPARLDISTWTAAQSDVTTVLDLVDSGRLTAARWLVDLTFARRSPELSNRIRQVFGQDAIRVAKNHSKFVLLANDQWKIVCRTSMNLNFNPRFENFQLAHDPDLYDFHATILDEVWTKQKRSLVDTISPGELNRLFNDEL